MGFKFIFICDLLSSLEENRTVKASTAAKADNPDIRAVSRWFAQHEKHLRHKDTDQLAVLSCLFPEKLPDRVYWLQHASLARVIGRCLLLGLSRREELERWRVSGERRDLGECVERVMRQAENHVPSGQEVSVEEVDAALVQLASRCRFSGPRVRRQHTAVDVEECLGPLYRRMSSRDAKWLTRMILKNYSPVILPASFVLKKVHFLLPHLLLFQNSLDSALKTLASERIRHFPPQPDPGLARDLGVIALECLSPVTGVKIGRPDYCKARSIKHCCQIVDRRRMSIERKYDGEYCQIHIDLSKHPNSIQIFSKSGKDSTMDRSGIQEVLRQALRIGSPECRFSRRCILEGELLVYSDKHRRIMGFHKLRQFISRSGTLIGTECDSLPQPYEHLMIVFFDLLVVDDDVCVRKAHRERRLLLKDTVRVIDGRAGIAEQVVLDFSHRDSPYRLEKLFAKAIAQRWEGCVLKGCDDPYFPILQNDMNNTSGRWIKLKKDYIPGLGDTVDLALVGAKYMSQDANALKAIPNLLWTHFFIGALVNKEDVLQRGATPRFRVMDVINRHCASLRNIQILNQYGEFYASSTMSSEHGLHMEYGKSDLPQMDVVFKTPFVVEMLGSGFERPSNARFYALRFPRITKIHWDRTFEHAVSFQELQSLADESRAVTAEDDPGEQEQWSKRIKLSNGKSQYAIPLEQSFASTTASTQETVGCNEPGSQDGISDMSELDTSSTNETAGHILIHVDDTAKSRSPSIEANCRGTPLTENVNRSSCRNPKALSPVPKPAKSHPNGDYQQELSKDAKHSTESSAVSDAQVQPGHLVPTTIHKQDMHFTSPQYQSLYMALDDDANRFPSSSYTTDSFFQSLANQYDKSRHKSPTLALGLAILDPNTTQLGPEILDIINGLSQCLQKAQLQSYNFPPSGKIIFLDSSIWSLRESSDDLRFCFRTTWENISRVYYYACVSWKTNPSHVRPSGSPSHDSNSTPTSTLKQLAALNVSISVTFEKEEMSCLGKYYD